MREITVKNAPHPAIVDDIDFEIVGHLKWQLLPKSGCAVHFYRDRTLKKQRGVLMHRLILQPPAGMVVDHIDHDGLHNWRTNLRVCSQRDNARNVSNSRKGKTSRFKGVHVDRRHPSKFIAEITVDYRNIRLGTYLDEVAAAIAYNEAAVRYFGEFAHLNAVEVA